MRKLGKKQLTLQLQTPLRTHSRRRCRDLPLELADDGHALVYTFDTQTEETGIAALLQAAAASRASTSRTCIPARVRWRRSSSAWCAAAQEARA